MRLEARQGAGARLESIDCELDVDAVCEGMSLHTE